MEFSGSIVMTLVFVSLLFAVSSGIFTSKMAKKLIKKLRLELSRSSFHEELRQEFSSHFRPHQRFDVIRCFFMSFFAIFERLSFPSTELLS